MKDNSQIQFLEREDAWGKEWIGMPEYNNVEADKPAVTVKILFKSVEDFNRFNDLIKEHLYDGEKPFDGMQRKNVKSTWFPLKPKAKKYIYKDEPAISDIHHK